ncbi:8-oxo-dGTP pyrophosphatase MutT (NUDIX family) [Rhodovulum sulfidophilum]|uniref:NUDIX hydrolase n=1 Tax=Rhodovulum sulfidophilum TaxID=35806 RepID=UPI0005A993C6|nr:NUDIX domain-containing protein [Rhodovulum sulfidophilum]ANB34324.1 DNA mismatch repair protein MutT [Rhodovulum sulfidophilum DSM 1374]ANB38146.1 DNA mismatch repair protein MutT [Rhodovulum sulfidophilum]MCW2301913.1 8-oxo-dGTP pyrophosphatase MutT (NUDIX family) [Rhodovulum sulfidophilum]
MGETDARLRPTGGIDDPPIRDAATAIVLRDAATTPRVLMGQRGAGAAFMPNKVVFPGGAVDPVDATVPLACPLAAACAARLQAEADPTMADALAAAAIRELWEETGLILGRPGAWPGPAPKGWRGFAASGHLPSPEGFHFIFRAITPPGRPRRFDARFFLVEAEALASDPDDFSRAEDELSQLQWIPLAEVRRFDLPFITEVVLAEVTQLIRGGLPPASVPFFDNRAPVSKFQRLA